MLQRPRPWETLWPLYDSSGSWVENDKYCSNKALLCIRVGCRGGAINRMNSISGNVTSTAVVVSDDGEKTKKFHVWSHLDRFCVLCLDGFWVLVILKQIPRDAEPAGQTPLELVSQAALSQALVSDCWARSDETTEPDHISPLATALHRWPSYSLQHLTNLDRAPHQN
ncbi:hypothetical protein L209DRAFT_291310 [Thermothelomyces heterothallicus CBS 203.75]